MEFEKRFVQAYTAEGKLDGEMISLMLQSFNIETRMAQESAGATYGFTAGPMGEVIILVPEDQLQDAEEILQAYEEGRLELPDSPESSNSTEDSSPEGESPL